MRTVPSPRPRRLKLFSETFILGRFHTKNAQFARSMYIIGAKIISYQIDQIDAFAISIKQQEIRSPRLFLFFGQNGL